VDTSYKQIVMIFTWLANDLIHMAVIWDAAGNDLGNSKTIMLKVNNVEKSSSTVTWSTSGTLNANLYIGINDGGLNHSDAVIDNIKTYNICKTDFSDKDIETGYALQCYSESTIKQQGSYSLKGIAVITDSLNDTLTRTVNPTVDLTGKTSIKYDIYSASRTGSQIKIGIHDSGGTTTEHTANISSTGAWEEQTWDISAVTNANKDDIDSIIITIVNADAANTFYIDNMFGQTPVTGGWKYGALYILLSNRTRFCYCKSYDIG